MTTTPDSAGHTGTPFDLDAVEHTALTLGVGHDGHDGYAGQVPVEDVVTLLRAVGAVGWIRCEGPERILLMLCMVPGDDGVERLVVLREDVLGAGPVLDDVVGEIATRCGVHVCVTETSGDGPEVGVARRVVAYRTERPLDRAGALEVASLLGTDVVLVPAEGWVLAVPADDAVESVTPWPRRHRPVLSLRYGPDATLDVTAHLRGGGGGGRSGGLSTRALEHSLPGWWWSSPAQRVEVLVTAARRADLDEATAAAVAQLLVEPDPAATAAVIEQLSATGLDLERLHAVEATTGGALAEAVAALGVPQVSARLLAGEVAAADLPGAVAGERRGPLGVVAETLLARPAGTSLLARMRRWDHDHPARSVAYIATVASLAAVGYGLAAAEGHALSCRPWPRVLTVAAAGLTLDAAANAVVLAVVRHRMRRARV